MSLADLFEDVETRHKSLVLYSDTESDIETVEPFVTRNVTVEFRRLPEGSTPFVVVRTAGETAGSVKLETLEHLLRPTVKLPWDASDADLARRSLRELLDTTLFATFDRRQLLATVREFEERAGRVGRGHLHVGFQSPHAMAKQTSVYRRLAAETDLDVHLYATPAGTPPDVPGATIHLESTGEIGRYWFFVFVPADVTERQHCALLAEERSPGAFYGFWTYNPTRVEELLAHLESAYG